MRLRLACLLTIWCCAGVARAEPVGWDDTLRAVAEATLDLYEGESRAKVLVKVEAALEGQQQSRHRKVAENFVADLRFSIEREQKLASEGASALERPERFLMDSRMHRYTWRFTSDWELRLNQWMTSHPQDPATRLIQEGRGAIGRLIPLLSDRSPLRTPSGGEEGDSTPQLPRVCDMAIQIITYHSRCRWFDEASHRGTFHVRWPEIRSTAISQIQAWWATNSESSLEQGIRDHYPDAGYYGKTWMAEQLIRLGDERQDSALREEGVTRLRELLFPRYTLRIYAARVLARYGETVVPTVRAWLSRGLNKPGVSVRSDAMFYLARYGGRDAWELILELAQKERKEGVCPGHYSVLASLADIRSPQEPRWAVPILANLLDGTPPARRGRESGERERPLSWSSAEIATLRIQKLTGEDFGFHRAGSAEERRAAIERANAWWLREGRTGWTLEAVDRMRGSEN